jgi:REP element-mobilizing transposase RayT
MSKYPQVPPCLDRLFPNNPVFFVTACTYRRRPLLANDAVNNTFVQFSQRAYSEHGIAVGRYVILPDHMHLFVCGPNDFELGRWMGMLKQSLEKAISPTASPTGRRLQKTPFWQRRFFDHVLRSEETYEQKWNYVRDNPVRAGLVTDPDDWSYAGEIIVINRV